MPLENGISSNTEEDPSVMTLERLADPAVLGPFLVLFSSVVFIIGAIAWMKLPAFFALLFAAVYVGLAGLLHRSDGLGVLGVLDQVMKEFGTATGTIGYPIAAAVVIGAALGGSGAAERIVASTIAAVGERLAPAALLFCSFILSIPMFSDAVFFLLLPLVRALSRSTGRNYVLLLLVVGGGAAITHVTVPPTPGPIAAAELLRVDLGVAIIFGIALGILPAGGVLVASRWIDRRLRIPFREDPAASAATDDRPAETVPLPSLPVAMIPLLLPVVLIAGATFTAMAGKGWPAGFVGVIAVLGQKNVALTISAVVAVAIYLRQRGLPWRETGAVLESPLPSAGVIILITAAGGAYGAMIRLGGIGHAVQELLAGMAVNYVLLGWTIAAVVRMAQGSATVAMITAAGIMGSLMPAEGYGVHPVYVSLAIGYGALILSWMNDSGFWVFSRMGGLTHGETLRSWTVMVTVASLLGLIELLIVSSLLPFG